jgi:hypothetical protein
MRLALLATCFLMLIAASSFAQAGDPIVPPPDPPGMWRKLTHDDATTTSTCIGNPVTPLCAAETFWACFLRRQPELCDMVQAGVSPLVEAVPKEPNKRDEYRVAYARRPSLLDPVDRATEGNMKPQPGDVVIALIRRVCYGPVEDDSDCSIGEENTPPYVHMLRRQGEFWVYAYRFRARF